MRLGGSLQDVVRYARAGDGACRRFERDDTRRVGFSGGCSPSSSSRKSLRRQLVAMSRVCVEGCTRRHPMHLPRRIRLPRTAGEAGASRRTHKGLF